MGRLPRELEEKRLRLIGAARRGAFDSYMRRGRAPDGYERIAKAVNEAKNLADRVSAATPAAMLPKGRPTNYYTWRTAGDQKVRNAHAALNGRVFSWSNPPEHGHPGHEPNCRCWPEPYYGDPAVPDALLTMVRGRRLSTEPDTLLASIDTLTRSDGSLAASTVVMRDGTSIHSTFIGPRVSHSVTMPDGGIVRLERDGEARKLLAHPAGDEPVQVAQVGRLLFPPPLPPVPGPSSVDRALAAALLLTLPGFSGAGTRLVRGVGYVDDPQVRARLLDEMELIASEILREADMDSLPALA
jgi:SPP1 gp7 family putative phage head morphogenesis protein